MHFASHYRWLVYRDRFSLPRPDLRLLDIGSDDGGFVARMSTQLSVGLDLSLERLREGRDGFVVCADGTQIPFEDACFDHVLLSDVIEHVEDDEALVREASRAVKPGGTFWLSTTAADFQLFPSSITARAERGWGHVRKGYKPQRLRSLIGDHFDCEIVEWPELVFRRMYLLLWACSKISSKFACLLTTLCFRADRKLLGVERTKGHLYACAVRHRL